MSQIIQKFIETCQCKYYMQYDKWSIKIMLQIHLFCEIIILTCVISRGRRKQESKRYKTGKNAPQQPWLCKQTRFYNYLINLFAFII